MKKNKALFQIQKTCGGGLFPLRFYLSLSLLVFVQCGTQVVLEPQSAPVQTETQKSEKVKVSLPLPGRPTGGLFTNAVDQFGPLIVEIGEFSADSGVEPWAGWWYPRRSNALFKEATSPLQKYDQYVAKTRNRPSYASEFEFKHFYFPDGAFWAGRCDAWAVATLMEKEPILTAPVVLEGISFNSEDLKALAILTYDEIEGVTQYGQRYNADFDSIAEDIYPEQFHKILQRELLEKNRPFIMDKDALVEVWNTPIFQAHVKVLPKKGEPNVLQVITLIKGTQPLDLTSKWDALSRKVITFEYTYDLYGYPQPDGTFEVVYGLWTGDSRRNHPDFVWTLPEAKNERKSGNKELDVGIVDEILIRAQTGS